MSVEPLPPAVLIAFVPFCVASLTRSEIDRVFNAHGLTLPPDTNPYAKRNLVDAYCKLFDWSNEQDIQQFYDIVNDVLSLGDGREESSRARQTFLSVCTRNHVTLENGRLVSSKRLVTGTNRRPLSAQNPIHVLIDLFILYERAFDQVHHASTNDLWQNSLNEWRGCHPMVWGKMSSRNDTIRALADPAKAWLASVNSRYVDVQDLNLVESCAYTLSSFAISSSPMAMPDIYSTMHTTKHELWQTWNEEGERLIAIHDTIARLKDVAARAGAAWTLKDNVIPGTCPVAAAPRPDLVLVTVNEYETKAVHDAFLEARGVEGVPVNLEGRLYHDLGSINGTTVYHAISEMGSSGLGAMQQTVDKAIQALEPGAVIAVGIAFGVSEKNQSVGDILLSKQIQLYELQRAGTEIVLRGDKPHATPRLINHFEAFNQVKWQGARVRPGLILSGEKLIDNKDYRDQLVALQVEAVGGEMEGSGLYVGSADRKVDWIIVKAICDWADGNKKVNKVQRQKKAAKNAATFLVESLKYVPLKRLDLRV